MKLTPKRRPEAKNDIYEISDYFDDISDVIGKKFRKHIAKTVKLLCGHPEIGEVFQFDPERKIRFRTLAEFPDYVVFYTASETELLVLRMLHGSRDFHDLFE